MEYQVSLTESAKADIEYFEVRDRRIIVSGIISQLRSDANVSTRRRKRLRPNPVGPWEIRIGMFRVFYSVEADQVKVVAEGYKEHNGLYIRGQKVEL